MSFSLRSCVFIVCCIGGLPPSLQAESTTSRGWERMLQHAFNDAVEHFDEPKLRGNRDATSQLGLALALLNRQPKTQADVVRADLLLKELSTSSAPQELRAAALYFRARIADTHATATDEALALSRYRALRSEYPETEFAQRGTVKEIILLLYDSRTNWADRRNKAVDLAATLKLDGARKDAHLAIAHACLFFHQDPEIALHHLRSAENGLRHEPLRLDVHLQIAGLARSLGLRSLASEHYRAFLDAAPQDERRTLVQTHLEALTSGR